MILHKSNTLFYWSNIVNLQQLLEEPSVVTDKNRYFAKLIK